jgi:hypothetical protein
MIGDLIYVRSDEQPFFVMIAGDLFEEVAAAGRTAEDTVVSWQAKHTI